MSSKRTLEETIVRVGPPGGHLGSPRNLFPDYHVNIDGAPVGPLNDCGDNGALQADRQMSPWAASSLSCQEAAANLTRAFQIPWRQACGLCLCGHGLPGMISCGGGQCPTYEQNLMYSNMAFWQPFFARLKPLIEALGDQSSFEGITVSIQLSGCLVGAEVEGLQLLQDLLDITGAHEVFAPVALVVCNGQKEWYDPPSTPQLVLRGKPLPAPVPALGHVSSLKYNAEVVLCEGRQVLDCDADDITRVSIERVAYSRRGDLYKANLEGSAARELAQACDLAHPTQFDGFLRAMKTGRLTLELRRPWGATVTRSFGVLSDTLLQDENYPNIFYRTKPIFRKTINAFTKDQ